MTDRTRDEVFEDLFGSDIAFWQKDEDNEMTLVLHSWDGFKSIGDKIIDELGDLLIAGECWKPKDRCGANLKMQARTCDLVKIGKKLAKMLGVAQKRFTKTILLDKVFTTDAYTQVFCEVITVEKLIDVSGIEIGFSDTYDVCCDCNELIYTSATSYGDHGRWRNTDDGMVCRDCDLKNPDRYLDEYLEDLHNGKTRGFELPIPKGWQTLGETEIFMGRPEFNAFKYERGLHLGQCDNPDKQYKSIKTNTGVEDLLFDIECGQFDVSWHLIVRDEDYDKVYQYLTTADAKDLADAKGPGDFAKEALEGISKQGIPAGPPGHIPVISVDTGNGAVVTRMVSPQDFIDGKALQK